MCKTCGCGPMARSNVYRFMSPVFSYPDEASAELLQSHVLDAENCLFLLEDPSSLEALRRLNPIIMAATHDTLEVEFLQTFGHTISKECPPYEGEYGQAHIFQMSQNLADIAGFYGAFGLELDPGFMDRSDHLTLELEFMQFLCLKEAYGLKKGHPEEQVALCREAQSKFLGDHLGNWVFEFAPLLEEKATSELYKGVAQLLVAFMKFEMRSFDLEPGNVGGPNFVEPPENETPGCEECPIMAPALERGIRP